MPNGTPGEFQPASIPLTDGVRRLQMTLPVAVIETEPEFGGPGWTLSALVKAVDHDATIAALRHAANELESIGPLLRRELYRLYLASPNWAAKREEILERDGQCCQLCSRTASLNVHHNTYDRIGQEFDSDLVVLCEDCHRRFHGLS